MSFEVDGRIVAVILFDILPFVAYLVGKTFVLEENELKLKQKELNFTTTLIQKLLAKENKDE